MDFSGNISNKTSAVDLITLECLTNTRHYEKYLIEYINELIIYLGLDKAIF